MNDEILDHKGLSKNYNYFLQRLGAISLITLAMLLLLIPINKAIPIPLFNFGQTEVKAVGLLMILILIGFSITISRTLDVYFKNLSEFLIAIIAGLLITILEFIFKLIQNIIIFKAGFDLDYLSIIKLCLGLGLIVFLISIFHLRKLRNKSILGLALLCLVVMGIVGNLIKN